MSAGIRRMRNIPSGMENASLGNVILCAVGPFRDALPGCIKGIERETHDVFSQSGDVSLRIGEVWIETFDDGPCVMMMQRLSHH